MIFSCETATNCTRSDFTASCTRDLQGKTKLSKKKAFNDCVNNADLGEPQIQST